MAVNSRIKLEKQIQFPEATNFVIVLVLALIFYETLVSDVVSYEMVVLNTDIIILNSAADQTSMALIVHNDAKRILHDLIINVTGCNNGKGTVPKKVNILPGESKKLYFNCLSRVGYDKEFRSNITVKYNLRTHGAQEFTGLSVKGDLTVSVEEGVNRYLE